MDLKSLLQRACMNNRRSAIDLTPKMPILELICFRYRFPSERMFVSCMFFVYSKHSVELDYIVLLGLTKLVVDSREFSEDE